MAKDPLNNTTTKNYTVPVASGTARTLTYDLVGNLTDNGNGQTYEWDAVNRLTKITQSSGVTEFVYDGNGRRVKEKLNGAEIKRWIWGDEPHPCEERDASNIVAKRFYSGLGEQTGGVNYFYTTDHLGSVREMTNSSGTIQARYDYDPYGRLTKLSGSLEASFGFTGFHRHPPSGLNLTLYRAYSADLGRWLSRDPISEEGGINLYSYVANTPIVAVDPYGQFLFVGALIGGGIDLGMQLVMNGGNFGSLDWKSIAVSAAMGATGVGLGGAISKTVIQSGLRGIATRAALNAAGSAAISGAGQLGLNAWKGQCLEKNVLKNMAIGGVLGGAGSGAADVIGSIRGILAKSAFENASLAQRTAASHAVSNSVLNAPSGYGATVGAITGITISNLSPMIPAQ